MTPKARASFELLSGPAMAESHAVVSAIDESVGRGLEVATLGELLDGESVHTLQHREVGLGAVGGDPVHKALVDQR